MPAPGSRVLATAAVVRDVISGTGLIAGGGGRGAGRLGAALVRGEGDDPARGDRCRGLVGLATAAAPAGSPTVRLTRLSVPCGGTSSPSRPSARSVANVSQRSGVISPKYRQLTIRQGALPHSARHSVSSSVNVPSVVVPPRDTPETLFHMFEQLVRPGQHAGDVGAYGHEIAANRL